MKLQLLAVVLLAACVEHRENPVTATQSLVVKLVAPADPGAIDRRLPETVTTVTVDIEARDIENQLDTSFDADVGVYIQFLGTLTPSLGQMPRAVFPVRAGVAKGQTVMLPGVFGPTTLWIDNGTGTATSYVHGDVTGTTATMWFRDPFIADLQRPRNEVDPDALTSTPLRDKQIAVRESRHGDRGRLVVTSVFAQGYTVSDVQCADAAGTPPCVAGAYDHAMVFSFSAPRGSDGHILEVGETIDGFAGGLTEFNGLSEVGFPRTFTPDTKVVNPAQLPAPAVVEAAWFAPLGDPSGGVINFERNEAGPIEVRNALVCPMDRDYERYKQWKLAPSGNCSGNVVNVITSGVVTNLDPPTLVGRTLPRVVGILRPVNFGSFNVWIIYPRAATDLTLQLQGPALPDRAAPPKGGA